MRVGFFVLGLSTAWMSHGTAQQCPSPIVSFPVTEIKFGTAKCGKLTLDAGQMTLELTDDDKKKIAVLTLPAQICINNLKSAGSRIEIPSSAGCRSGSLYELKGVAGTLLTLSPPKYLNFDDDTKIMRHERPVHYTEVVRSGHVCYLAGAAVDKPAILIDILDSAAKTKVQFADGYTPGWGRPCAGAKDSRFDGLQGDLLPSDGSRSAWQSKIHFPAEECRLMGDDRGPETFRCEFPDSESLFYELRHSLERELNLTFHPDREEPSKQRGWTSDCEVTIANRSDKPDTGVIQIQPHR
jgi:hypothetical protein